jgi:hypothetical protein
MEQGWQDAVNALCKCLIYQHDSMTLILSYIGRTSLHVSGGGLGSSRSSSSCAFCGRSDRPDQGIHDPFSSTLQCWNWLIAAKLTLLLCLRRIKVTRLDASFLCLPSYAACWRRAIPLVQDDDCRFDPMGVGKFELTPPSLRINPVTLLQSTAWVSWIRGCFHTRWQRQATVELAGVG